MTYVLINQEQLETLIGQIGSDIKTLNSRAGSLSTLKTTAKDNLVNALNELYNITQINSSNLVTETRVNQLIAQAKNDLINGASTALDTLNELAAALNNDPSFATNIANQLNNRLRFDQAQTLTTQQMAQGQANLGLQTQTVDYMTVYTTARGTL